MEIIGIMGAMPDEVEQLCALLDGVTIEPYAGVEYHRGMLGDKQVVVCCAGMGKANAAATTQVLITKFGAQRIIFSGIAGNMTSKIGIGDVVVGKTVVYHDAQDDMIAQSAPFTAEYPGDEEMVEAAIAACEETGVKAIAGKIATGDQFVGDSATKAAIAASDDAPALRLDLRGMRADQAQAEVERFLDKALLSGFSEVEIVHGRGTGALRRQIHDFLRSFPAVARFATAPEDRGGDGMTIVNLR